MDKLKEYLKTRQEKEKLEAQLSELQNPVKEKIKALQEKMKLDTQGLTTSLEIRQKKLANLQSEICSEWPESSERQVVVGDKTITIKTITKPDIKDEDSLLRLIIQTVLPGNPLPFKVNWDKKLTVGLINAGVVHEDYAVLKHENHLAVGEVKEE